MTNDKLNYRRDIDGLRAIAVIFVVIYHGFQKYLPGGYIGVDIFFVISGFLITKIIHQGCSLNNFSIKEFYFRRIRRIFPALILVLATSFLFAWYAFSQQELQQLGKHTFSGGLFFSNIVLFRESGYFEKDIWSKPLLNLWSLGVEEQFYIFWPLFFSHIFRKRYNYFIITSVLIGASLLVNVLIANWNQSAAFYLPLSRLWELLIGGILALPKNTKRISYSILSLKPKEQLIHNYKNVFSILGLIFICISATEFNSKSFLPGWWLDPLLPTIGTYLIIASGPNAFFNKKFLSNDIIVWIGTISYPLYLWHWPLLSFLRIIENGEPSTNIVFATCIIAIIIAWLTKEIIEKPIRFTQPSMSKVISLCASMAFITCIGITAYMNGGFPNRIGTAELSLKQGQFYPPRDLEKYANDNCKKRANIDNIPNCTYLANDMPPSIALIGDSHATHLFHGISEGYKKIGENLVHLHECMLLFGVKRYSNDRFECEYDERIIEYITRAESIKTVIISNRGVFNIEGTGFGTIENEKFIKRLELISNPSINNNELVYQKGLYDFLTKLEKTGKNIIYIVDNPEMGFDPVTCLRRPINLSGRGAKYPCALEKSEFEKRNFKYLKTVKIVLEKFPNIKVFYPSLYLCDTQYCWAERDGNILYLDDDHLSYAGSRYIGNKFYERYIDKN